MDIFVFIQERLLSATSLAMNSLLRVNGNGIFDRDKFHPSMQNFMTVSSIVKVLYER